MTTIAGTSWAQREALRALARACDRAGGPVPLRKLFGAQHDSRIGKLLDLGLAIEQAGEIRVNRDLIGRERSYVERIYAPTDTGRDLLLRTTGEPPPAPTPLRDEHWTLLALLARAGSPRTAAGLAASAGITSRQAGARLTLLARHDYADSISGDDMYAPTRWFITPAGQTAFREAPP